MYCRLCFRICNEFENLYDDSGQQNECYKVTAKYFSSELNENDRADTEHKISRVICSTCWKHISDFSDFQQQIQDTQENYGKFPKIEENSIKLEMEKDVALNTTNFINAYVEDVDIKDPVDFELNLVAGLCDSPFEEKELDTFDYDHHRLSSDEDEDVPLKRITRKKKSRQSKLKPIKVLKKKTKQLKKSSKSSKIASESSAECSEKFNHNQTKKEEHDKFIADYWKKDLYCSLCDYGCTNFTVLCCHYKNIHNTPGYLVCCDKKFFHRTHLVDHINVHLNVDYFKCELCNSVAASRRSLVAHMQNKHPTENVRKKHECQNCHKKFLRASCLRSHIFTHVTDSKNFVCQVCGKGFVKESLLKVHTKYVHEKSYNRVCELCGKSLIGKKALRQHLLQHEGIAPEKFPCDICDAQLYSKYSLGRHKKQAHADNTTVYVCSECGKVARTENALRSHQRYMHKNERKFNCNICNKAFKVALTLKEHMTTHTGEDLYKCPHCPRTFRSSANMHHHRKRVHPKEWEEKHKQKILASKMDLSLVEKEVVL